MVMWFGGVSVGGGGGGGGAWLKKERAKKRKSFTGLFLNDLFKSFFFVFPRTKLEQINFRN